TSHLEYELDRVAGKGEGPTQPSLADMTSKAIDVLSKNSNGYFLMVEGGRIDHALHGTNAKRALEDTAAFDEAIRVALSKVDLSNTL
ncbi:alkaline phosphatase, partial [Bacteroides thetaiotaomicron]|nr:alkaline phosphatase [Bacteroides thetaiotaomicron]